jgi:hypothetical protein
MSALMTRCLFLVAALLVSVPGALVAGEYQHTRDGKTMVWNNDPKPGDEAAWSGSRDDEGYAAGFGTLTWYKGQKQPVKTFGIPIPLTGSSKVFARYFGNMVRGKFDGPVNAHTGGKTAHAFFTDGARASIWARGPAPSRMPEARAAAAKKEETAQSSAKPSDVAEPKAREIPKVAAVEKTGDAAALPQSQTEIPATPIPSEVKNDAKPSPREEAPKATPAKKSQAESEVSLSSLVGPPASLHTNPVADASAAGQNREKTPHSTEARLTKEVVLDLADAEANARGYSPAQYGRAEPSYNSADEIWSVSYKPLDESIENGKRFSVTVDDKTKGIVFVPGK